jgi:hypothetical protein
VKNKPRFLKPVSPSCHLWRLSLIFAFAEPAGSVQAMKGHIPEVTTDPRPGLKHNLSTRGDFAHIAWRLRKAIFAIQENDGGRGSLKAAKVRNPGGPVHRGAGFFQSPFPTSSSSALVPDSGKEGNPGDGSQS